uniref:phosphoglycerate dehydrogenase n=1 Tax=Colletotrichum fructicola (strain Nara gc5) TaxID=1213859 RepID=L2GAL0_COLFN
MAPSAIEKIASNIAPFATDRPRILVPEKVSSDGLALLKDKYDVDNRTGLSADELVEAIPNYHALIVRSETKVNAAVLAAGRKLRVVARAGVGVDNIDVDAATNHGIIVVNSPAGNILAAAEHTIALLLATARNVGRADTTMKDGKWERGKLVGVEVGNKTLGIIGLGKVGMKVARMAIGLGMKVKAVDPYASNEIARQANVELVADLQTLLPVVDFLTIHTPLMASTLDLLKEEEFQKMKKTARVLNVARGGVYNEAALLRALDEGWIAGAGLDVFTSEPDASRTDQAPEGGCNPTSGSVDRGLPTAAVNAPLIMPEEYRKLQPFVRLVEKMGGLYTQHFVGSKGGMVGGRRFELIYQGDLAGTSNTRPLFAALVKGLVSSITDSGGRDVNIVNASLIAKEKGMIISETHSGEAKNAVYASLVTLRSHGEDGEQVIEGYVSGQSIYISKLDRFSATFQPQGTLLVLHNYDEPGKIGGVGTALGRHGINITFMQVASLDGEERRAEGGNEALMILGVKGEIGGGVVEDLQRAEGILNVSLVRL